MLDERSFFMTSASVGSGPSSSPASAITASDLAGLIDSRLDRKRFQDHHWTGTFFEYLEIVSQNPSVCRNAYQRLYDSVVSCGSEKYRVFKHDVTRYHFFSDPFGGGADAIFGLDFALMQLVDFLRSASEGYGTDKRILLLHGPVGSSKSTIARLLKKGAEAYSRTPEGALYSYSWMLDEHCELKAGATGTDAVRTHEFACPMHEDPLVLVPREARDALLAKINEKYRPQHHNGRIRIHGDPDPFCRKIFEDLMTFYKGDWKKVMEHVKVRRIVLSEKDRVGIGRRRPVAAPMLNAAAAGGGRGR